MRKLVLDECGVSAYSFRVLEGLNVLFITQLFIKSCHNESCFLEKLT